VLLREPADLGELRPQIALEGSIVGDARSEVNAAGNEVERHAGVVEHRPVRPGDQAPATVLRRPVTHLRAGKARLPDLAQDLAECARFLRRNHVISRITADDLLTTESRRALAGVVEEDDPPPPVQNTDERLRGLGQNSCEVVAESEFRLPRLGHPVSVPPSRGIPLSRRPPRE
jgi:hypothetical protein